MTEVPGLQAERTTLARIRTALTIAVTALIVARAVRDDPALVAVAVLCAALPMASVVFSGGAHRRLARGMHEGALPNSLPRLLVMPIVVVLLAATTALGI